MINFGVWSPDEATFWQSWRNAGVVDENNEFTAEYGNKIEIATSWPGIVTNAEGVAVPGWHTNVRVSGPLEAEMTYGLPQTDADGNLLSIWERTWAAEVFQLVEQPSDPVTGFPAGYRNSLSVTYADAATFSSPSNVWT